MNSDVMKQKLDILQNELEKPFTKELLCKLTDLLFEPDCDTTCYELASTGLIKALKSRINQNSDNNTWDRDTSSKCFQKLLLQDNIRSTKHIFLHTIATHQSTGEYWVIPAIAKEFAPILLKYYEQNLFHKNAILCLMIVREFVGEWITQKAITDLHLKTFPEFTANDLSLPYSNLFESAVYHKNVSDLKHYIFNCNKNANNLKLHQLVYITWLFNKETLYPYQLDNLLGIIQQNISASETDLERSSAKSLLIHHAYELKTLNFQDLNSLANQLSNDGSLVQLIDFIAKNQKEIKEKLADEKPSKSLNILKKKSYQGVMGVRNILTGRTGMSFPIKKKLKVAVCVSGQLRGYKEAFETWKKSILVDVNYDIYVHSWTNIGRTNAEPFRKFLPFSSKKFQDSYREYCLTFGFENMQKNYPTLFQYLKQSAQVTEQEIKEFYGTNNVILDDESMPRFKSYTNSEKMHYKIHACHNLMQNSGEKYDLVIRVRPDFSISFIAFNWNDILDWCNSTPIIFSDIPLGTHYMSCMMGDQFALGNPKTMEIYADTWDIYPKLARNKIINCEEHFSGHHSIAMNCWAHSIKIEKLPMKKNGLLEAESMKNSMIYEAMSVDAKGRNSLWDKRFLSLLE